VGAAALAGLAEGMWSSTTELSDLWVAERTFAPSSDPAEADRTHRLWLDAVERSRGWATGT
jgi:glycerol kinase